MNNKSTNIWYKVGFAVGVAAIIYGVLLLIITAGDHYSNELSYAKYGADFYTDIHSATIRAANVLRFEYEMVRASIAAAFVLSGITEISVFATLIKKEKACEAVTAEVDSVI